MTDKLLVLDEKEVRNTNIASCAAIRASLFDVDVCQSNNMLRHNYYIRDDIQVHWFPRHISELDLIANRTLDAGVDLEADHPGFHDTHYRQRRAKLAELALNHRMHHEIPHTEYTKEEVETWGLVWDTMEDLWAKVWLVLMMMLCCRSGTLG
jgi:hypothetical protein